MTNNQTPAELLPCPFCGGDAETYSHNPPQVGCVKPMCRGNPGFRDWGNAQDAVLAWNTRTAPQAQVSQDGQGEDLQHTRTCQYWNEDGCTCALEIRKALLIDQALHEASHTTKLRNYALELARVAFEKHVSFMNISHPRLGVRNATWEELTQQTKDQWVQVSSAILTTAKAQAIKDGWVCVPREPCNKQLDAAVALMLNVSVSSNNGGWTEYAKSVYRAMISAAPTMDKE